MSAERLFEVIGLVDDNLLEEAERYRTPYKERHWARWGALAACAVLIIGGAFMGRVVFGGAGSGAPTGGAPQPVPSVAPSAIPSAAPGESGLIAYAGPILPLTAEGDLGGLTAEREVSFTVDDTQTLHMGIADSYTLTNATAEDKVLDVCYPYREGRDADERPAMTLDGEALEGAPRVTGGMAYCMAEVRVPANGAVELTVSYRETESKEGAPYELVTTLGSSLTFTTQKATLELPDSWEVAGQSFGFDVENGITEVTLDLSVERYYLEVRRIGE